MEQRLERLGQYSTANLVFSKARSSQWTKAYLQQLAKVFSGQIARGSRNYWGHALM